MNNLEFRRQFLISPVECNRLSGWKHEKAGDYNIYVHPDCDLIRYGKDDNKELVLIGYFFNPNQPQKLTGQILDEISVCSTINDITLKLYDLAGRFVLFVRYNRDYYILNDACGLKSVFYTKYNSLFFAASQPLLLKLVTGIENGPRYYSYFSSKYVKNNREHWIPAGTSLFENVSQLVPNHYLDISRLIQVRFWPVKEIRKNDPDDSVEHFSSLLKNTMSAASERFPIAISLTSGLDSRMILSACRDISHDIFFYTLRYRNLKKNSGDIRIPGALLSGLGYSHHIIDCRKKEQNGEFLKIYSGNTDIPHLNDWGIIAAGIYSEYPEERIAVKGNCAETGRCYYYEEGTHKPVTSAGDFTRFEKGWQEIGFIRDQIEAWYGEIKDPDINFGYDLLDLFYWEHRMGSWQAGSQLEWDIVQEVFTPFNNRELIDIMLSVDPAYRSYPDYQFFFTAMGKLWKEVLKEPVNPESVKSRMRRMIKKSLISSGLFKDRY